MRTKRLSRTAIILLVTFGLTLLGTATAFGEEKVLYSFLDSGVKPCCGLIWDAAGNLYGTTQYTYIASWGPEGYGTVFELSPNGRGGWSENVLDDSDGGGYQPQSSLISDAADNLYGTKRCTYTYNGCGTGSVFELTPGDGGRWTLKVLIDFDGGRDGAQPYASLIWDAAGNLYGTNVAGGAYDNGTVFELTPTAGGSWTVKTLHSFGHRTDGAGPFASLIWDAAGNLYGTTVGGSSHRSCGWGDGCGTVFELSPNGDGTWTEAVLHNFGSGMDGQSPQASLIRDAAGNLYGTTSQGGVYGYGTVFEMMPNGNGRWTEKVLHNFGSGKDGRSPTASLIWDAAGNLYGTAYAGGVYGLGTVFEMMPREGGGWTEHTLHHFGLYSTDGQNPTANLVFDAAGHLFGTTTAGGVYGFGTVFEVIP